MRNSSVLFVAALAFCAAALPFSLAMAEDKVMVIGDSWPAGYADNLETQFATHGHGTWKVKNSAIPGSTAEVWADDVGGDVGILSLAIAYLNLNPSISYVVVSLGGNDLHGGFPMSQIEEDLRTVVGRLSSEAWWLAGIILPGYDILEWNQSTECLLLATALFGSTEPGVINPLYLELGARQQIVASEFPKATYLHLWGTGQNSPGSPDEDAFSLPGYVSDDCIHLTETGYNKFTKEIYCQYFAPAVFGETCDAAYAATANAEAASFGSNSLTGSGTFNGLSLLLFPAGVVIFMRIVRRKR